MKKRFWALLLAVMMVVSVLPTAAFAEGGADNTTTGYYYDDSGTWVEGVMPGADLPTGIRAVNKTAEATNDPNVFEITLTVETTLSEATVAADAATVLVLDHSNSMDEWINVGDGTDDLGKLDNVYGAAKGTYEMYFSYNIMPGGDWYPLRYRDGQWEYDKKFGGWTPIFGSGYEEGATTIRITRINAMKIAAKNFVDVYGDASAARWVSVVSFGSDAEVVLDWTNVSADAGAVAAKNAIDRISIDGGTNLDHGLQIAGQQLESETIRDIPAPAGENAGSRFIIALTDGVPTYYYDGSCKGTGGDNNKKNVEICSKAAIETADSLKSDINTLYTICFAGGESTKEVLKKIASSEEDAYTANTASDLSFIVSDLGSTINQGTNGEGLVVTDPMAAFVSVTGNLPDGFVQKDNSSTYEWTLEDAAQDGEIYTYTLTYQIEIDADDPDFEEDTFYPTNGVTYLTYGEDTVYFPVPGVKGIKTDYTVTYDGNGATTGTEPPAKNDYHANDTVTVLGNTGNLDKTVTVDGVEKNFVFAGWNTKADGTGTTYQAGNTFTITGDTTLYAIWETDDWNDPNDQPTGGDDIPDKYQALVTYKVVNGAWNDETKADKTIVVTLRNGDGVPSATGSYTLTESEIPAVGAKPDSGFKAGSWNVTPVTVTTTTTTFTYTYSRTTTPVELPYETNYYFEKTVGGDYEIDAAKTTRATANEGSTVTANELNPVPTGYVLDMAQTAGRNTAAVQKPTPIRDGEGNVTGVKLTTVELYYSIDANGDNIPDKYQAKVTYQVVNGTWGDGSNTDKVEVFTLYQKDDTTGAWMSTNVTLGDTIPAGMKPAGGYTDEGAWNVEITAETPVTKDATYTYTFTAKVPEPGVSVTKTVNKTSVTVGDTVKYTITVKNTGNVDLTNVNVVEAFGGDFSKIFDLTGATKADTFKGFVIGELKAGETKEITFSYKTTKRETLTNSVVVEGTYEPGKTVENEAKSPDVTVKSEPITPVGPSKPQLNYEDHYAYVVGYPDGLVHPERNITRAEVATIFFRMLLDESREYFWAQENDFSDVAETDWFNNAVSTLANAQLINGYPDGSYRPNANITRAEFATIAIRFFLDEDVEIEENNLSDVKGHWAEANINLAYALELINGYPDGTFRPDQKITRAEAMAIVNRVLKRAPEKDHLLKDMIEWPDNLNTAAWYYADVQEATNSHKFHMDKEEEYEIWTELLPVRDWVALEQEWSKANSSKNPGEVVDIKITTPEAGDNGLKLD